MIKEQDRLFIDKEDRKLYSRLNSEDMLNEKSRDRKEQFIFALSYGFKNNVKRPLVNKEGFIRSDYLTEFDQALIKAVAIYDSKSIDILNSINDIYTIAEQYAHAGIKLLVDKIEQSSLVSFDKLLEKEIGSAWTILYNYLQRKSFYMNSVHSLLQEYKYLISLKYLD